jgi:dolichyl-phosphate beta-glucosyltransferase
MQQSYAVSVVVPAYNEEKRLPPMVEEAVVYLRGRDTAFELLVVDDGSRDRTSSVVQQLGRRWREVRLIRLAQNHGKGYAVRTGVVNAHGASVLFADADGATPIAELARLEAAIEEGADLAIGSRAFASAPGVHVRRKWYRHLMGRVFHGLVAGLGTVSGIRDTQCGFKLFRGRVAHDLFSHLRMSGFSFDVELLLMAQRRAYRVVEVPVNWVHQPGSKVDLTLDSLRMAVDVVRIRTNWLRGHYEQPQVAPGGEFLEPGFKTPLE